MSEVEKIVRDFYDNYGWVRTSGQSGEDLLFRQYSPPYYEYHRGTTERTVSCFSGLNGKLLIPGGGDLPEYHITIAEQFAEVCCLDISQRALDVAKDKLGQVFGLSVVFGQSARRHVHAVFIVAVKAAPGHFITLLASDGQTKLTRAQIGQEVCRVAGLVSFAVFVGARKDSLQAFGKLGLRDAVTLRHPIPESRYIAGVTRCKIVRLHLQPSRTGWSF